jgi:PAS domain S-box-containing protein
MQNPIATILPELIDKLSMGVVYQNTMGEIVYANHSASVILGLSYDQLIGKTSVDPHWKTIRPDYSRFPGEEHPAMMVLKTGKSQNDIQMGITGINGNITWIKINSHPFFGKEKKIEGAITSFSDITHEIEAKEKLAISERNQHIVLSSITEGFYLIDRDYKIILINKGAQQLHQLALGKSFSVGDNVLQLFSPQRLPVITEYFKRAFTGEKIQYDVEYKTPENEPVWLTVTYSPVAAINGEINNVCIGIINSTLRKKAEEELKISEGRFRTTLSYLGDDAWEHDFVTGKTIFSDRIDELFAYDEYSNDNMQMTWINSVHPDDVWMINDLTKNYRQGIIDHHVLEYRLRQKNGEIKWILDRGLVVEKDTNGTPLRAIGTRTNITERKRIEDEIKSNERKFRAIFNSTYQFMGLMSVEGILLEANQTAVDFFRLPKDEVMGMNFLDSRWFSEPTREKSKAALAKAASGKPVNYELVVIDFSIRPIFDEEGKVILLVPEGRDITEKLKLEKEFEQARINKQKDILNAGIEGQEKQRREVARELHDNINQVLATVKIYLQLAGENEELRKGLISKCYENVSHAIEEVRKLSKTLAPPTLDDSTLIEALQQMANDMVLSMLYEINFSGTDFNEALLDNAQKMAIYRIAQEQFTNILKYAQAKKICFDISTNDGEVIMVIEDDGIGFNTSEKISGTGIKNMMNRVEAHNGLFELYTSPGKGCRLQIRLPLTNTPSYERN